MGDRKPTKRLKRARRRKGEGSIFYHERLRRWTAVASLGLGPDGKRQRRQVYGATESEVVKKLKSIEHELRVTGSAERPTRKTLASFLGEWLEEQVAPSLQPTTLRSYKGSVDCQINGEHGLGGLKLRDVTPKEISSFYARLRKHGAGDRTLQLTHAVLHRALRHALRQELIPRNPAALVDAPTYKARKMNPLTNAQIKKFLAAAKDDRLEALYVLAVLSGVREGELLALEWRDFDPVKGIVRVRQSQQDVNGVVTIAPTKTDTSRRQVYLPKVAVNALREHRKRMTGDELPVGPEDRVFTAPRGGPLRRKNFLSRSFKPLLERAGLLKTTRFHDLRHTYATKLLTSGADPKVIQSQLGHSKIGVTLDTYAHLMPSLAKSAVRKLDDAFGPSKKKVPPAK
ncbi:MAG: site-specific integrase [Candidatus Cybelea sp.]